MSGQELPQPNQEHLAQEPRMAKTESSEYDHLFDPEADLSQTNSVEAARVGSTDVTRLEVPSDQVVTPGQEHTEQPGQQLEQPRHLLAEWTHPERGLQRKITGVYLGAKTGSDGWNTGHIDESETPVDEAGLVFGVDQASYGFTGIFAKALPGYRVEALTVDPATGKEAWVAPAEGQEDVRVTGDWGRMSEVPIEELMPDANFANTGGRAGVVRVTSENGQVKHYLLGADFRGKPDQWRVSGAMVEIEPQQQPGTLSQPNPELPA